MKMFENYNDVLTVNELKDILRVGKGTAYKLIKDNKIKSIKIEKKILILKEDLINFLTAAWNMESATV